MHTVYVDSTMADAAKRHRVYDGQSFVFTPRRSTRALIAHARDMIEAAFPGKDPQYAQFDMTVVEYVDGLVGGERVRPEPREQQRHRNHQRPVTANPAIGIMTVR